MTLQLVIVLALALLSSTALADTPACKDLKDSKGVVIKDSSGHKIAVCILTADNSYITADSTLPINARFLATEDGAPIKTPDGKFILAQ